MTDAQPASARALQRHWRHLASQYGLRVDTPFTLHVGGREVTVPVRLRDFGGRHGMLLVTQSALVLPLSEDLVALGFGYSCLDAPEDPETVHHESLVDMLADWGWSGEGTPPAWLPHAPR